MDKHYLKYNDHSPIYFPVNVLKFHPGGLTLPNDDNIVTVTEKEKAMLLKRKNGPMNIFTEIEKEKKSKSNEDK